MEKNTAPEVFNEQQETYLRSYYKGLDDRLGVTKDTPEYLAASFNRKLEELARPKAKGSVSWKALGSAVAVSLTLGVLLARLTMMPVGVTTRGGPAEDQVSQRQLLTGSAPQVIALVVEDPKGYSLKVVEAALAAEIEVSAIRAGAKYQVVLEALISRTAIQSEVKKLLKLKEEASGNFTVILSPSSK